MRQGIMIALLLATGSLSAQQVHKCVSPAGEISYQSDPCPPSAKREKAWDAKPDPRPTAAELRRRDYERRKGEAESRYLSRIAGTDRGSQTVIPVHNAVQPSRCAMTRSQRDAARNRRGLAWTFDEGRQWDDAVREACK